MILRALGRFFEKRPEPVSRSYTVCYSSYDTVVGIEDSYVDTIVDLAKSGDILGMRHGTSSDFRQKFVFNLYGVNVYFFPHIDWGQVVVHSDNDQKNQDVVQFLSSRLTANCGLEITLEEDE